ncbi:MAG: formyltransferase family protein, partial [Gammaproteobacteria bacterium]
MKAQRIVRIFLLGHGTLALALLEGLLAAKRCQVTGVFRWSSHAGARCSGDPREKELRRLTHRAGVTEIRCESANSASFIKLLKKEQPHYVLLGTWGEILRPPLLRTPDVQFINCHPSLLPAHRGTNPYASVIRNSEPETGLTFHLVDEQID